MRYDQLEHAIRAACDVAEDSECASPVCTEPVAGMCEPGEPRGGLMGSYDPDTAPDPKSWLSLDESDRLVRVTASVRGHEHLPRNANPRLHATIHLIVENQVAMGDSLPVASTLQRLLDGGLQRHDAIHAIGAVLSKHVYRSMRWGDAGAEPSGEPNDLYWLDLEELTPESWRATVNKRGSSA